MKKKIKFSSYMRKFRMEQVQSHIWLTAPPHIWGNICAFPHILGSPSLNMTLQLLHYEFPYIWGKFDFLFYQCASDITLPSHHGHNLIPTPFPPPPLHSHAPFIMVAMKRRQRTIFIKTYTVRRRKNVKEFVVYLRFILENKVVFGIRHCHISQINACNLRK